MTKIMNKMPKKLREELAEDPRMRVCCVPGCGALRPSWHHCWTYKNCQIQEKFAIMPVCPVHHQTSKKAIHNGCRETKEIVEYLSLKLASKKDLAKYPRKDWKHLFNKLKEKYGKKSDRLGTKTRGTNR